MNNYQKLKNLSKDEVVDLLYKIVGNLEECDNVCPAGDFCIKNYSNNPQRPCTNGDYDCKEKCCNCEWNIGCDVILKHWLESEVEEND